MKHLQLHKFYILLLFLGLVAFQDKVSAQAQVDILKLFKNKVVVVVNGMEPQTLSLGQTYQGVKLVAVDSKGATLLIDGK